MLDLAFLVPLVPFTAFWIILFFGKRLGTKFTSTIGIGGVGIAFLLALVIGAQWIERAESAADGHVESVEVTTNGDTHVCEGIVVVHGEEDDRSADTASDEEPSDAAAEDDHAEDATSDDEDHAEDVIEAETGEELESAEDAHESGVPPCDTVALQTLLSTTAAGGEGSDGGDGGDEGHEGDDDSLIDSPSATIVEPTADPEEDTESGDDEHGAGVPQATLTSTGGGLSEQAAALAEESAEGHESGAAGPVINRWTWFTWGSLDFYVGTHLDGLAAMMLFVVGFVSLLVHIYSTEYLKGDRRYTHYFAFLSLFTASMLFFVLSENILQSLVGWELVGVCSFVLIGHWWEEKENTNAALKAFLTNRVGDVGLLVGVVVLFWAVDGQTFSILGINEQAATGQISHGLLLVAALCLFWGVTSKSGQFPLHTWLPDAMAGPTPVSALIHAATMVVAGVYLVARLYPVFYEGLSMATGTFNYVALIGGLTTIIGGVLAFVQRDIKKVLAYSTISQLGYMILALGVGAWTAAVFHIFTHAFFKAGLFLGAGSVSHAVHHSFDMKADMGGLRKYMPQTFITFLLCSVALAGFFPFAGFWSKDEILAGAVNGQGGGAYTVMLVMGLVTAALTAAYMTRCIYLTFFGEYRGHGEPHESPRVITIPLWILSAMAVVAGLFNLPGAIAPDGIAHKFQTWVEPTVAFAPVVHADFMYWLAGLSLLLAGGGVLVAYLYYWRDMGPHGLTERSSAAKRGYDFLANKYYLDHLYTDVIVGGIKGPIARGVNWFNQNVLDGIVNAAGKVSVVIGRWTYKNVDQTVIDGAVNASGFASEEAGQELSKLQTGKVQQYGALLFGGAVVLAALLVVFV